MKDRFNRVIQGFSCFVTFQHPELPGKPQRLIIAKQIHIHSRAEAMPQMFVMQGKKSENVFVTVKLPSAVQKYLSR